MKNLFLSVIFIFSAAVGAKVFKTDIDHTQVGFKIKHLVISTVNGKFDKFEGTFDYDLKKKILKDVNFVVDVNSINTANERRDKHLKSPDFFFASKYPKMTFKSLKVKYRNGKPARVIGNLTIRGVTKKVPFDISLQGPVQDPWGNEIIAFQAKTEIKRMDFKIAWNKKTKHGTMMVGNKVKIIIEGEANPAK